jgi:hypothetical protein
LSSAAVAADPSVLAKLLKVKSVKVMVAMAAAVVSYPLLLCSESL